MFEVVTPELLAYQKERLAYFQLQNQKVKEGGSVFVGDSIMEFFPLKKYLGQDSNFHNRGVSGIDSQWLLTHIGAQILDLNPKQIFILIGTNDIGLGYSLNSIIRNIKKIVEVIFLSHKDIKINLLSVLPVSEEAVFKETVKVRNNQIIDQLNRALQDISGINYIDIASNLKTPNNDLTVAFTKDGLHLNLAGYQKIADEIKNYL
ncbi:SGNH/GDSL hydrolase family protein [Streptococcus didelphis]|uniref:SGNH/GDSL hydrolase family protein n=1 Tax=Streptococcus didelphis TaxID=102886 RepID=A0ABY9LHH5_9STRE|nr:SGNH/GDSL hydrolase family protein [Streptococcus didelphis]WMB28306.1 SGNH/GDSL hydrolase family protein [Streptococcus didelphis]WMB28981.1 SGNH/GDSL hydrolase family protein [Streptococcus didelphis]